MPRLLLSVALLLPLALAGCANPRYGVFATSTNLGIDADVTAGKVVIGYDRTEGFVGPGYPETGTAPSVFGFIESDQNVFNPKVRQLYATGSAAELVTQDKTPDPLKDLKPEESLGPSKIMVFGTTTSIALRIGYGPNALLPDSISFGYKRREASLIPVLPATAATPETAATPAKYVSTLASIDMNTTTSTGLSKATVGVRQFFATGNAARNLAADKIIRGIYRLEAEGALSAGARDAAYDLAARTTVASCIQKGSGKFGDPARMRLEKLLSMSSLSAAQKKAILEDATDPASLSEAINKIVPGSTKQLQQIATEKAAQLCEA